MPSTTKTTSLAASANQRGAASLRLADPAYAHPQVQPPLPPASPHAAICEIHRTHTGTRE
eukprot:4173019-Pleurochrysis_carterae.AAC.2